MKKRNLFLILALIIFTALPAYADSLESVRVIKFWDDTDDLVVERSNGDRLLLQHNPACRTMSTEFPMQILWSGDKVTKAKVAVNEICKVYNFGPYSSDLTILKRIPASNVLTTEHLAEVNWKGSRYEIDYGAGCKYLRDYENKEAYVYTPQSSLNGATLYLPKVKGKCEIKSATFLETIEPDSSVLESPIRNLQYQAENNQALLSWDAFPDNEIWYVFVAHSKYPIDSNDFTLSQMPALRRARGNSIRILQLVNDQPYYFYITAGNKEGELAPWTELYITPVQTTRRICNNPDPEPFQVEMTENENAYHLVWPDQSENSRRYLVMVYVDGKRETFKIIDGTQNFFDVEKKPELSGTGFRFTVRSLPKVPTEPRYFDSIFWKKS
ncbi:hypothetical protein KJ657_00515 [Patescibacteria group bacterium]|nr:hypothetical protein [Patescibacteria group bacterium]MBU1015559.1 hypothetical protein [Patescibacteria group bacterium]MBU1685610.1 hypothetical protein [Patescibacteria group bacterium]MBU1938972.1 hypothetical protein [Patescibacteria group bacterium]